MNWRLGAIASLLTAAGLFTMNLDGSDLRQLSFSGACARGGVGEMPPEAEPARA